MLFDIQTKLKGTRFMTGDIILRIIGCFLFKQLIFINFKITIDKKIQNIE